MTIFVPIFLFGWPLVVVGMFAVLRPLQAVVAALVGGWLFLPVAGYSFPGFPDYTKISANSLVLIACVAIFDPHRFSAIPARAAILPFWVWMAVGGLSALSNGFGPWDAFAITSGQVLRWGVPFIIGVMYFRDQIGMRVLIRGLVIGAIVYLPLVLYELRMAPVLHHYLFGFNQHSFVQTMRFGGLRPMVFLDHGLALSMWYACAAVAASWLAISCRGERIFNLPISLIAIGLVVVCVACKSVGAIFLMVIGLGILVVIKGRMAAVSLLLGAFSFLVYFVARIGLRIDFPWAVSISAAIAGDDRASSLAYRLETEAILVEHASSRFLLGWSSWGRNVDVGHLTDAKIITDSLWIIAYGQNGVVGLVSLYWMLLAGVVGSALILMRQRIGRVLSESLEARVVAILVLMICGDSLFNAMPNPVWTAMAGGLLAWSIGSSGPRSLSVRPGVSVWERGSSR